MMMCMYRNHDGTCEEGCIEYEGTCFTPSAYYRDHAEDLSDIPSLKSEEGDETDSGGEYDSSSAESDLPGLEDGEAESGKPSDGGDETDSGDGGGDGSGEDGPSSSESELPDGEVAELPDSTESPTLSPSGAPTSLEVCDDHSSACEVCIGFPTICQTKSTCEYDSTTHSCNTLMGVDTTNSGRRRQRALTTRQMNAEKERRQLQDEAEVCDDHSSACEVCIGFPTICQTKSTCEYDSTTHSCNTLMGVDTTITGDVSSDCLAASANDCQYFMLQNDQCDEQCNVDLCGYDNGMCEDTASLTLYTCAANCYCHLLGDGVCDEVIGGSGCDGSVGAGDDGGSDSASNDGGSGGGNGG
jgi:hypothetical protein